jgi:hypothetical protein
MGCTELDLQIQRLKSSVHIFGHSHLNIDTTIGATRYVQSVLGYPNDRWCE